VGHLGIGHSALRRMAVVRGVANSGSAAAGTVGIGMGDAIGKGMKTKLIYLVRFDFPGSEAEGLELTEWFNNRKQAEAFRERMLDAGAAVGRVAFEEREIK